MRAAVYIVGVRVHHSTLATTADVIVEDALVSNSIIELDGGDLILRSRAVIHSCMVKLGGGRVIREADDVIVRSTQGIEDYWPVPS